MKDCPTRAAELVLQVCALLMRQQLCRLPKEVSNQLFTRGLVEIDGKKADIEPKKDWKRANKGKRPNELDAVAVMIEGKLQRKVLSLTQQCSLCRPSRLCRTLGSRSLWSTASKPGGGGRVIL